MVQETFFKVMIFKCFIDYKFLLKKFGNSFPTFPSWEQRKQLSIADFCCKKYLFFCVFSIIWRISVHWFTQFPTSQIETIFWSLLPNFFVDKCKGNMSWLFICHKKNHDFVIFWMSWWHWLPQFPNFPESKILLPNFLDHKHQENKSQFCVFLKEKPTFGVFWISCVHWLPQFPTSQNANFYCQTFGVQLLHRKSTIKLSPIASWLQKFTTCV